MQRKWAWTSLAIATMWVAVLFVSLFAPEVETRDVAGNVTKVPVAAFVVAGCAFVATIVVAVQGFRGPNERELEEERQRLERERLEARIAELERRTPSQDATTQDEQQLSGIGLGL